MADPFVAEIRIFGFNFAPKGWAFCNGQLIPISQNTALFSLVGTFYGGNGKSNFALPNLQDSAPLHQGQGPGLTERVIGEAAGSDTVTLIESELPLHSHQIFCDPSGGGVQSGANATWGESEEDPLYAASGTGATMAAAALASAGGDQPHNNMPPYLTLNFCIALQGVFPPRS